MAKKNWRLKAVLSTQVWFRDRAEAEWKKLVEAIRTNPNQTNVRGIWIGDMLRSLQNFHIEVLIRDGVIREIEDALKRKKNQ